MDYDPIVLAASRSSAKECITESVVREHSEAGLQHNRSALLSRAWVTTRAKSP